MHDIPPFDRDRVEPKIPRSPLVRDRSVSGISGKGAKFHVLRTHSFTTFICISISGDALLGCGDVERGSGPHLSRPLAMLQTRWSIYNVFIKNICICVYTF